MNSLEILAKSGEAAKSGPIGFACTSRAGSMPIFFASCSAAPSARLSCGMGRVKDTCTMPSPVVSP